MRLGSLNVIDGEGIFGGKPTHLMFGQTPEQAAKRVLILNYPSTIPVGTVKGIEELEEVVKVDLMQRGLLTNKFAVVIDDEKIE